MEKELLIAVIIMVLFGILKWGELQFFNNDEPIVLKFLVRDALEVALSSFLGVFIFNYAQPILNSYFNTKLEITKPPVFTDEPGF